MLVFAARLDGRGDEFGALLDRPARGAQHQVVILPEEGEDEPPLDYEPEPYQEEREDEPLLDGEPEFCQPE